MIIWLLKPDWNSNFQSWLATAELLELSPKCFSAGVCCSSRHSKKNVASFRWQNLCQLSLTVPPGLPLPAAFSCESTRFICPGDGGPGSLWGRVRLSAVCGWGLPWSWDLGSLTTTLISSFSMVQFCLAAGPVGLYFTCLLTVHCETEKIHGSAAGCV